jgi:uncharacterized membrane protein YfcA
VGARALLILGGIGVASGFFGALFGVGGGIVIVPLLVMYGFDQRRASATSLAAILVSAAAGAATYAFHGQVKPLAALIVGLPAVGGVLLGTSLQARISLQKLSYGFALLLAAVGVRLLV